KHDLRLADAWLPRQQWRFIRPASKIGRNQQYRQQHGETYLHGSSRECSRALALGCAFDSFLRKTETPNASSYFTGAGQNPGSEIFRVSCCVAYFSTAGRISAALPISMNTRLSAGKCFSITCLATGSVTASMRASS